MNKLNHIESLLESVRDDASRTQEEKDGIYDIIDGCIGSYTSYHNEAVNQGQQLAIQRFRLSFDEFAAQVADMHERRKSMHMSMIDHTIVLNSLCEAQGLPLFYQGKLDKDKGRSDPDTRFGVAQLCEEVCHDLHKSTETLGIPAKAHEAFRDYASRLYHEGQKWTPMQKLMAQAKARSDMSAEGPEYH